MVIKDTKYQVVINTVFPELYAIVAVAATFMISTMI